MTYISFVKIICFDISGISLNYILFINLHFQMNQQKNKKVHFGVNFLTPEDQSHIFYFSLSSYMLIKIVALLQSEHKDKVMFTILNVLTLYYKY